MPARTPALHPGLSLVRRRYGSRPKRPASSMPFGCTVAARARPRSSAASGRSASRLRSTAARPATGEPDGDFASVDGRGELVDQSGGVRPRRRTAGGRVRNAEELCDVANAQRAVRLGEQQEKSDDVRIDSVSPRDQPQPGVEPGAQHEQPVGDDRDVLRIAIAPWPEIVLVGPPHGERSHAARRRRPDRFDLEQSVDRTQRGIEVRQPSACAQISRFRVPFNWTHLA